MRDYMFLFKEKDSEDRDCFAYVETSRIGKFECEHYFPSIGLHGAGYSKQFSLEEILSKDKDTIFSDEEFKRIAAYNDAVKELGYGIKRGDERYQKGIELTKTISDIIQKLKSEENKEFLDSLFEEEKEILMDEYNLDEQDIEVILEAYSMDYKDRSIICRIYDDAEELATEYCESIGALSDGMEWLEKYIDYEKIGEDMLEEIDRYVELSDKRVVELSY